MSNYILYDYWRSSAAYRVRIALNLKGLPYEPVSVNLKTGEHRQAAYLAQNPQGAVPMLVADGVKLTQSMAIMEYLEETHPEPPLLPSAPADRALARAMAQLVISDIHPVNNLRVLNYLSHPLYHDDDAKKEWYFHWIKEGLKVLEGMVKAHGSAGKFCFGDRPTFADLCLIPQMYNAQRFNCPLEAFPTLVAIDSHCNTLPAFQKAIPEAQPDAAMP